MTSKHCGGRLLYVRNERDVRVYDDIGTPKRPRRAYPYRCSRCAVQGSNDGRPSFCTRLVREEG